MCFAQEHNTVTLVSLESPAPWSRVKHSITEPLFSYNRACEAILLFSEDWFKVTFDQ